MQFTALDLVTCAGALCFGSEEEYSVSDFDENSHYSDDEGDMAAAADELIDGSDDDEEEESGNVAAGKDTASKTHASCPATTGNISSHKNEHDVRPTSDEQQQDGKGKTADAATADNDKTSANGNCDVPEVAVAKNHDGVENGKEIVYDNDDDDHTIDTALDVTQDVSASEEDDDESAEVEPAYVKIDLDDNNDIDADIDAFVLDLESEFAPEKDEDEVALCTDKDETEEEEEEEEETKVDEKSVDTNKAEEYSGKTADRHPDINLVEYTPQEQKWNVKYADLLRYYKLYGTSKIPLSAKTKLKHILLRRWADKQRKAYLKGNLTEEQVEKLAAVRALDLLEV